LANNIEQKHCRPKYRKQYEAVIIKIVVSIASFYSSVTPTQYDALFALYLFFTSHALRSRRSEEEYMRSV